MSPCGRSRVLDVPYLGQPTSNTCQSTCLSMMAKYLEQDVVLQSTGAGDREILAIWKDVNEGAGRPAKVRNAHVNMKWWLEQHFPMLHFDYITLHDPGAAAERIIRFIDGGFPVMVAISHARVVGHIILVVGYENYVSNQSTLDFRLVAHDPYGKFDPSLLSKTFGKHRFDYGVSLSSGGQIGPGRAVRLPLSAASRQRAGDPGKGTFYLISAHR